MAAPEYDFFATGPRSTPPPGSATDRFGMPGAPQAPVQQQYAATQPAPAVNQFGLPVDAAVPTGPHAAPGYGAVPVHNSIAAGYDDAPTVWDPTASTAAHAHRRAAAAPADVRPGSVLAAGVISIVFGVLAALGAALTLVGYLAAKSEIEQAVAANPDIQGLDEFASAILGTVLVVGLVMAAASCLYLVMGVMTVRGRRWAGWTLVVLSALSLLGSLYQRTTGVDGAGVSASVSLGNWLAIAATAAMLLLLTVGEGGRWLRRA